jgi:hypothetical protein
MQRKSLISYNQERSALSNTELAEIWKVPHEGENPSKMRLPTVSIRSSLCRLCLRN